MATVENVTMPSDEELDDLLMDTDGVAAAAVETDKPTAAAAPQPPKLPTLRGGPFYFDLETTPDYERLESFGLDPLPAAVPVTPARMMPPLSKFVGKTVKQLAELLAKMNPDESWLATLADAEQHNKGRKGVLDMIDQQMGAGSVAEVAAAERCKLLSTTPEYCRIAAIGWAIGSGDVVSWVATEPHHERGILEAFWRCVEMCRPIVGYNIIGFDLPVIFFRSALLKVPSTKMIDMKPWGKDLVDLYAKRFPKGNYGSGGRPGKLKELAPLAGIKVPAGDVEGSQVAELMKTDPVKVGEYVRSDVEITRHLHHFYSGYFCE